jgi:hypothetical protein
MTIEDINNLAHRGASTMGEGKRVTDEVVYWFIGSLDLRPEAARIINAEKNFSRKFQHHTEDFSSDPHLPRAVISS